VKYDSIKILRQLSGRFDNRFQVGPALWPHHDLLWVNEGTIKLIIGTNKTEIVLSAPAGLVIFPNTPFYGEAVNGVADASICHFKLSQSIEGLEFLSQENGFFASAKTNAFHIQYLVRLGLHHTEQQKSELIRNRLLISTLDCFADQNNDGVEETRVAQAWSNAQLRMSKMRTLTDVATGIGLSESMFRRLHRQVSDTSAGSHLRELRLARAEELLATTGMSVANISKQVGYAHPESFSAAFTKSRGRTPANYRRLVEQFA
jgi:AraC-like DNA-binding protein